MNSPATTATATTPAMTSALPLVDAGVGVDAGRPWTGVPPEGGFCTGGLVAGESVPRGSVTGGGVVGKELNSCQDDPVRFFGLATGGFGGVLMVETGGKGG